MMASSRFNIVQCQRVSPVVSHVKARQKCGLQTRWRDGTSRQPHIAAAAPCCRRRPPAAPRSQLGFDLPGDLPSHSIENQAEQLLRTASSLLLYQPVLRGAPAKAFLSLLVALAGGPPTRVLESFGDLFRALAADGHPSWRGYVLEQVRED